MSNFTLDKLPVTELTTPESIVGNFAIQSATADFDSLVARHEGEVPIVVEAFEFVRDLLKYKASIIIGSNPDLLRAFHGEYRDTFSQLNTPEN